MKNARDEVLQNARIMMESALASRAYTSNQVRPLLETQMRYQFLPQSVPAYAATEQFNDLRKAFPEYFYKEAVLNPTNPRNRATDWEADVVNQFRQTPERTELVGERDTPTGRALHMARPIQTRARRACLATAPCRRPKTMIDLYARQRVGWKLHEVIGARSSPSPCAADQAGRRDFRVFISPHRGFRIHLRRAEPHAYFMVIRPVTRLSAIADEVSLGKLDARFQRAGQRRDRHPDGSFNRMRTSLVQR